MQDCQSISRRIRRPVAACGLILSIMMTGGSRAAAQSQSAELLAPSPSAICQPRTATAKTDNRLVINADLVTLRVSVADPNGHYIPGLRLRDFTLSDNQIQQQITFFSSEDLPASIAVVFDVSGSMSGRRIAMADEALATFVQSSHKDDEYSLIAFNSRSLLMLDRSRDGDALISSLSKVKPDGNTALYDATYLALDRIARGTYQKRALLIISDGEDNASRHTLNQVRRALMESDVTIYAIDVNATPLPKEFYGRLVLDELANISGGKVFTPESTEQMTEALDQIAIELRHQYSIGYRPTNFTLDGKWHRLKVKVTPPSELKRVSARTRTGYYAIGSAR